jgi:tetratricopeptide (TPR) repeat protein
MFQKVPGRTFLPLTVIFYFILPGIGFSQSSDDMGLRQEGIAEFRQRHFAKAETLFRQALEFSRRDQNRDAIAMTLWYLGDCYLSEEQFREAEEAYNEAVLLVKQMSAKHLEVAVMLRNLGIVYSLQQRNQDAIRVLNEASKLLKVNAINEPHLAAQILNDLGVAYFHERKLSKAEALITAAIQSNSATAATEPTLSENFSNLALIYQQQHKYVKAEQSYQRSLEISERIFGRRHPFVALTRANLGQLYTDMRRFEDAENQYRTSLAITEQGDPVIEAQVVRTLYLLSMSYVLTGRRTDAEAVLARAVEIIHKNTHLNGDQIPAVLDAYSALLKTNGKIQQSALIRAEAKRARAELALTVRIKNEN